MKTVIYEDENGYLRRSLIREEDDENEAPHIGIPFGPPDVREIDWGELARKVNNVLVSQGAFTWENAQASGMVGIQAAITLFKRALIDLYRHDEDNHRQ